MRLLAGLILLVYFSAAPLAWAGKAAPESGTLFSEEVQASGEKREDVELLANERAAEKVQEFLKDRYGDLLWKPRPEALRRLGILQVVQSEALNVGGVTVYQARIRVEITRSHLKDLRILADEHLERLRGQLDEIRTERMTDRHRLAGFVLGVLVVCLIGVMALLRVDEITKGYLTNALIVGLVIMLIGGLAVVFGFARY